MNINELFTDPNSIRIWENYFKRVRRIIRVMDGDTRQETELEIQDHLYQGFQESEAEDEVSRLLGAIDRLGEPEEFLRQVVSEKFLKKGTRTFSPRNLILGLFFGMWGGLRQIIGGMIFGVGYLLTFLLGLTSFVKIILPSKLGLFVWPDGSWIFGMAKDTAGAQEILGYWIIPLSLTLTILLYLVLTLLLKITMKK